MIRISERAKDKLAALMAESGLDASRDYVRVRVSSGGCSGLSYKLDFDKAPRADDKVFEDKGTRILVDAQSFLYLVGTTLEYAGGLNGKGFYFDNPNASRTCGCGESFAV